MFEVHVAAHQVSFLNNIYTHKVKKTWKQEKAAFENIIWSAAVRIAATTLRVFESLRFEETGRFVSFTADEIVLRWPLVQLYLLHPTSYHNSNNLRNSLLLYGGSEFKSITVNCHDPTGMFSGVIRRSWNIAIRRYVYKRSEILALFILNTYAAIKQTLLWITIFKDTLCLPQQLSLISIIKRCPLCAKKCSIQSLWTVNNFVIVRMADTLTAFNAVKLPRIYSNLVNRP